MSLVLFDLKKLSYCVFCCVLVLVVIGKCWNGSLCCVVSGLKLGWFDMMLMMFIFSLFIC